MKMVTAIVKPFKLDEVREALSGIGVQGIDTVGEGLLHLAAGEAVEILATDHSIPRPALPHIPGRRRERQNPCTASRTRAS